MKVCSNIALVTLLALCAAVLVENAFFLYSAPLPNSWIWWPGDETWLLAQYKNFILTGHYINPLAPGSIYAVSSGIVFGSCYVTALLYGLPLIVINGHSVDVGRTISYGLSLVTLFVLWFLAKRYRVSPVLCAFGCLMLAATLCFFMMSHSARSDMLIGLVVLIFTGGLPLVVEQKHVPMDVLFGILLPVSLLINGHALIISGLMFGYLFWSTGGFRSRRSVIRCASVAIVGFIILLIVQATLLGSFSITGPFADDTGNMPFTRLLHPKAHFSNYYWRLFIAELWAPGMIGAGVVVGVALAWARIRFHRSLSQMSSIIKRLLIGTSLVIIASIYLEYQWPRYLIYVLPTIVLSFVVIISFLFGIFSPVSRRIVTVALAICLMFSLWRYEVDTMALGRVGEQITEANKEAISEALVAIHSRKPGRLRIFSAVSGQGVTMDDSCDLLTPVMYDWPSDKSLSRREIWNRANIDYAIVFKTASRFDDRRPIDSSIGWLALSHAQLIFERVGAITDIDRPYDQINLQKLDTLRVYEFQR